MKHASLPRWGFFLISALMLMGGLAMSIVRPQSAGAVVGGYVELHVVECPPGYDGDSLFDDCHENRVAGVTFIAAGAGGERNEMETDVDGVAFFNDFYAAGPLTITEKHSDSRSLDYQVFCTTTEDQTPLPVTGSSTGDAAATIELPQSVIDTGTGVVCDWYSFPPGSAGIQPVRGESDHLRQNLCET